MEMSNGMLDALAERVNALDFDHPFTLTTYAGYVPTLRDADGVYAPSVYHDEKSDVLIDGDGWEALTGFTGQHGYNGAVNHSSEFVGREIARELVRLAEDDPQTFVMVSVEVLPSEDDPEPEAAGWAILRKVEA